MTSLHLAGSRPRRVAATKAKSGSERRIHRRHDLNNQDVDVQRWDGDKTKGICLGKIVDLSAGGVRIRTDQPNLRPDSQVRVRLELPVYAGISPFVNTNSATPEPRKDWVGWMSVSRVIPAEDGAYDVAGRLVDMEDIDRGMLGLYLSTQPLAA